MNLHQFSFLSKEDQQYLAETRGSFIGSREECDIMFDLYSLEDFYVEFFYLIHDHIEIKVRCFTSKEELKPYTGVDA
jgi:hypothetical protein